MSNEIYLLHGNQHCENKYWLWLCGVTGDLGNFLFPEHCSRKWEREEVHKGTLQTALRRLAAKSKQSKKIFLMVAIMACSPKGMAD